MTTYTSEPLEWKSAKWYRNRPIEERLLFFRAPQRIINQAGDYEYGEEWEKDINFLITSPEADRNIMAYDYAVEAMKGKWKLSARWIAADDYVEMVKDDFNDLDDKYESPYLLHNIKKVHDIVVLADLGDERETDFASHELKRLIVSRWENMKPMIITSRFNVDRLSERYGPRVAEALATYEIEVP